MKFWINFKKIKECEKLLDNFKCNDENYWIKDGFYIFILFLFVFDWLYMIKERKEIEHQIQTKEEKN